MRPARPEARAAVVKVVRSLFGAARARLYGGSGPSHLVLAAGGGGDLLRYFDDTAIEYGGRPHAEARDALTEAGENYMRALEERTVGAALRALHAAVPEDGEASAEQAQRVLGPIFEAAGRSLEMAARSEVTGFRNVAAVSGIVASSADFGVQDAIVYFVTAPLAVCEECMRLHRMPDRITPRLWLMSEVGAGYHKRGEDTPKLNGLHPNCRCTLASLLPGYGFSGGKVVYKGGDYDELALQRDS